MILKARVYVIVIVNIKHKVLSICKSVIQADSTFSILIMKFYNMVKVKRLCETI